MLWTLVLSILKKQIRRCMESPNTIKVNIFFLLLHASHQKLATATSSFLV